MRENRKLDHGQPKPSFLIVPYLEKSQRLDKFLIQKFPKTSRHYWKKHLDENVQINEKKPKKGQILRGGEKILIKNLPLFSTQLQPNSKNPLKILYQDHDLLALDKPAGIPCHPLAPEETQTLANVALARFPELCEISPNPLEAGLIHRLDNETSGVLLFARHKKSYDALRKLNRAGGIAKFYLAWVEGLPPRNGNIDLPIAHHPKNKAKMLAVEDPKKARKWKARMAHTEFRVEKKETNVSLLLVRICKGARHQIRVHLAAIGHPIVGDKLYGDSMKLRRGAPPKRGAPTRHLLHARKVEFLHPFTHRKISIVSPSPRDFKVSMKKSV